MRAAARTKRFDLDERLLWYTVRILEVVDLLPDTRVGNHVASQLLLSGLPTTPSSSNGHSSEAPNERRRRLRVSVEQLREIKHWLKLILAVPLVSPGDGIQSLIGETDELIKVLVADRHTAEILDVELLEFDGV